MAEIDDLRIYAELAASRSAVERAAKLRMIGAEPMLGIRSARYEKLHQFYAPVDNDQWPEDRGMRPGKMHLTVNIIKAFVNIEARILGILPRIVNRPDDASPETRQKAEVAEKVYNRWLELSAWDVWMIDWNKSGSLYGLKVLRPVWNTVGKRPDVEVVELPQNLAIGWSRGPASNTRKMDWAIYKYSMSAMEAMVQFPDVKFDLNRDGTVTTSWSGGDHADPLDQLGNPMSTALGGLRDTMKSMVGGGRRADSEFEKKSVVVWDYWYRKPGTDDICNALLVGGTLTGDIHEHPEYPEIPYIVTENDHEPGSNEGMSTAEDLIDIQMGMNRAVSLYHQVVSDEVEKSFQLIGDNADEVPPGLVPKGNEIIAAGTGNKIEEIGGNPNQFPVQQLINDDWELAYKVSGINEILFGSAPGSQESGRALATQIEAAANRLVPKRNRSYAALITLLQTWGYMVAKMNPKVTVGTTTPQPGEGETPETSAEALAPDTLARQEISVADMLDGLDHWAIVAPEITPRDQLELVTSVINQVNARLMSLETGMDRIGIEAPIEEIARIEKERSNASLFPADVQSQATAAATLQSIQQTEMAMQAAQGGGNAAAGGAGDAINAEQQAANPTLTEDENQPQPGGGPGGGTGGVGTLQSLSRVTPGGQAQAMSQVKMTERPI